MRADDGQLLDELRAALAPEPRTPDAVRVAALRDAVSARAATTPTPMHSRPPATRWWLVPVLAAGSAAAVVAAFLAGGIVIDDDAPAAEAEFAATLVGPEGSDATASVTGTEIGIGRVIRLETDDLPILPKGELYQVWFVGAGDTPERPNRISAGTFHPDLEGRSEATFTAAVDPTIYPTISVTAEPGDGDPQPSDVEVLRADVELQ